MSQHTQQTVREIQQEYKHFEKRSGELADRFQKVNKELSDKFKKAGQQASEVVITIEKGLEK